MLYNNIDRPGQQWNQYAVDRYGNREFRTRDDRLCAKIFWVNGMHTIRVCYTAFISKNGLWRYDNSIPTHRSKSKAKAKAPELPLPLIAK